MSNPYQNLTRYEGTMYGKPRYASAEFDWEVPDNLLVGSPGGVSSIHHHWTRGFNGRGNTSGDIFAGQGQRYNSGIYGNLYQTGQEASQHMGYFSSAPDYQYWQAQEPQQYSYDRSIADISLPLPQKKSFSNGINEGYLPPDDDESDFELIQPSDDEELPPPPPRRTKMQRNIQGLENELVKYEDETTPIVVTPTLPPWVLFLFFLMAFVAFAFWAETGLMFVSQHFHKGKKMTWKQGLMYSVIITVAFAVVIWAAGVPLTTFETF